MGWVPPPAIREPEHWTEGEKQRFYLEQKAMYQSGASEAGDGAKVAALLLFAGLVGIAVMLIWGLPDGA